jgi:hypothetical protein
MLKGDGRLVLEVQVKLGDGGNGGAFRAAAVVVCISMVLLECRLSSLPLSALFVLLLVIAPISA